MIKISIIIPIYKVEQYLDDCIQSVFGQTYANLEIVLVDDGSPDNCPAMCDNYAVQDERVRVIHKENGGAASARNVGLNIASGELIMFVDADDCLLEPTGIEQIVSKFKNDSQLDAVLFRLQHSYFQSVAERRVTKEYNGCEVIYDAKDEMFSCLLLNGLFTPSPCVMIVKRELLVNNNVYFELGLFCEDIDWSIKLWNVLKKVSTSDIILYNYRHRADSTSNQYLIKQSRDYIYILKKWINTEMDKEYKKLVYSYLADLYASFYRHYFIISRQYRSEIMQELKSLFFLLNYASTTKAKRLKFTYSIVGIRFSLYIWGIFGLVRKKGFKGLKLLFVAN